MPRTGSMASNVGPVLRKQHFLAGKHFKLKMGDYRFENVLWFEHASFADLAACLFAACRAEDRDAIAA